jgi:hypothetical protein
MALLQTKTCANIWSKLTKFNSRLYTWYRVYMVSRRFNTHVFHGKISHELPVNSTFLNRCCSRVKSMDIMLLYRSFNLSLCFFVCFAFWNAWIPKIWLQLHVHVEVFRMCLRLHIEVSAMRILKTSSYTLRSNTEVIVQVTLQISVKKWPQWGMGMLGVPKFHFYLRGYVTKSRMPEYVCIVW